MILEWNFSIHRNVSYHMVHILSQGWCIQFWTTENNWKIITVLLGSIFLNMFNFCLSLLASKVISYVLYIPFYLLRYLLQRRQSSGLSCQYHCQGLLAFPWVLQSQGDSWFCDILLVIFYFHWSFAMATEAPSLMSQMSH